MTFTTDPVTLRTVDAERQLEFIRTTGGPDGRRGRALLGPGFRCDFDAYLSDRKANEAERLLRPDILRTNVWSLRNAHPTIPGLDRQQTYELLGEAILGERLARHDEVNWSVRFPANPEE